MPVWICATCANHYPDQERPPADGAHPASTAMVVGLQGIPALPPRRAPSCRALVGHVPDHPAQGEEQAAQARKAPALARAPVAVVAVTVAVTFAQLAWGSPSLRGSARAACRFIPSPSAHLSGSRPMAMG
jgi:hypothetical protein